MSNWITHQGVLYNLDRYCQIVRGDEEELLLCSEPWGFNHTNECYDSLIFKNKKERDAFEVAIYKKLEVPYTKKIKD